MKILWEFIELICEFLELVYEDDAQWPRYIVHGTRRFQNRQEALWMQLECLQTIVRLSRRTQNASRLALQLQKLANPVL